MAKEIKSVVKIGMNYTEIVGGTTEVNRRIKLLDSEFRKAQESAKAFGNATDELKNRQDYLTQKIELQTKKVDNMRKEYEKIKKEKGENSKEAEKYATSLNYAERALIKLEGELQKTSEDLKEQSTRFADLQEKLEEYGRKAEEISSQTGELGGAFLKLSAPIMAFSIASGKMAMDFEEAMAKISTMVDTSEVDMKKLEQGVINLSKEFGKSTGEMATGMYNALSAGVEATKVTEFMATASKVAIGAAADVNTAVDALTNVMNAYGMEVEDVTKVSNELFIMKRLGKMEIDEYAQQAGRLAPIFNALGGSSAELATTLAVLTKNGIQSRQAVTGLSAVMSNIAKPSKDASDKAKELGINLSISGLQAKGFTRYMEDLIKKTRGSEEALNDLFGSQQAFNVISVLASAQGGQDFVDILKEMEEGADATDEAFEKMADTTAFRLSQSIEEIKISLTEAGAAILPILDTILKVLTPLFTLLSNMNPVLIQMIAILGLFLATTGTILKTISGLTGMWGSLAKGMAGFNMTAMKTTLIVMGVVAALIALLTLITVLTGKTDDLERSTQAIGNSVGNIQGNVNAAMQPTGSMKRVQGSHRTGLDYVPRDNYIAELHEGERVLTKEENKRYSEGSGQIVNVYVQADDLQQVADVVRLFEDVRQVSRQGV